MPQEVRMPSLGQTTDELRITRWLKAEGDAVRSGEPLLEVETDKATIEVESFTPGILLSIVRPAGALVEAGALVAYIGVRDEAVPLPMADGPTSVEPGHQSAHDAREPHPVVSGDKILASPVARQLAREHGIDLRHVRGSGPQGRIEKADVRELVEGGGIQVPTPGRDADLLIPRHRQVIAQRLTQSIQTIPHFTLTTAIDMTHAGVSLATARAGGLGRLTYTHLALRALAQALRAHPAMNRLWISESKGPIYRELGAADVGLAVAGENTLRIVTIPEPDAVGLEDLVRAVDEAVRRGRSSTLNQTDVKPVAITLSNLGMYTIDSFQAIIDPGQTAILATGRVADRVVVIDGDIRGVPQMQASLSVDHRVADGVLAATFLRTFADRLEQSRL